MSTKPALISADALVTEGLIDASAAKNAEAVGRRYAIRVTPAMAALIDAYGEPIGKQFLPDISELTQLPEELSDPIGDDSHSPLPGLVHRYPDRVLLKPISVCPVYCRYCFRRETVGAAPAMKPAEIAAAVAYIAKHPEIWEVVLTGGDPLMLKPASLARIVKQLESVPHLRILRLHTRVPIADPDRVSQELVDAIKGTGLLTPYVAIHCNHASELTEAAVAAAGLFADNGIPLLGQSVLLAGVNAQIEALEGLMRALVAARIRPYYLHHLDLAPGTARFRVDIAEGQALMAALRGRVSGLCQPTYVLDVPGGYGKSPLTPSYVKGSEGGSCIVRDPFGQEHLYPPPVAGSVRG